jgi:integrase
MRSLATLRAALVRSLISPASSSATEAICVSRKRPWLCAYTGARVGEITQLRKGDVIKRDGIHALKITPEAGTVKNAQARVVPLHQHLIAQGSLKFVEKRGGRLTVLHATPSDYHRRR